MQKQVLVVIVASAAWAGARAEEFVVAERGQAKCSVVCRAEDPVGEFAAAELRRYVKQMSGAELPTAASERSIVLSVDPDLGWDGFRVEAEPGAARITGGNARGLLYGVYHVLEGFDCRFLALGPEGENVPQAGRLALPAGDRVFRPTLRYRGLIVQQSLSERNLLMADWMAKNGMNYWVNPCGVFAGASDDLKGRFVAALEKRGILWEFGHHTFRYWITRGGREQDVLGIKDGKRTREAICISNPRAAMKVADNIEAFVRKWPQVDVVSLWANDGLAGWCECAQCEALYGDLPRWRGRSARLMARPYFWFVGQVADRLRTRGIKQPLCSLAYVNTIELLPDVAFAPNTWVTVAPIGRNYAKPIAKLDYFGPVMDQWAGRLGERSELGRGGARVMAYEYYAGVYANNSLPIPTVTELAQDVAHYAGTGFGGITTQAEEGHWGTYGLDFYALARMGYHGPRPAKELIAEFCRDYYGPAAGPMTQYWAWQEELIVSQESVGPACHFFHLLRRTDGALDKLDRLVADAEKLAATDLVRSRVRLSRLSVEYMKRLRDAIEAGRGQVLDALPPTPKGASHLGAIRSGKHAQLRFPVLGQGGLEVCLGNVVALSGGGHSYQLEVRRDGPTGPVVHSGRKFEGTPAQAEKHIPGRAWNEDNRAPIALTRSLTDADRRKGHIDLYVTAHTEGDLWTLYRDDDSSKRRDIRAQVPPVNAERERKQAWDRLESFVREHAQSGILNAAPRYVLSRCRQTVAAYR